MGVTHQQIIDDVLDRYEAHLGFLTYSTQHDYASVLTPPVAPATGSIAKIEPAADNAADGPGKE
jgi:choline/glycine/proline betaine transport protein